MELESLQGRLQLFHTGQCLIHRGIKCPIGCLHQPGLGDLQRQLRHLTIAVARRVLAIPAMIALILALGPAG